jgi:hypothetical protein
MATNFAGLIDTVDVTDTGNACIVSIQTKVFIFALLASLTPAKHRKYLRENKKNHLKADL